jgi:HK97 family phage major capsid protein
VDEQTPNIEEAIAKAVAKAVEPLEAALKAKATSNMTGAPMGGDTSSTAPEYRATFTSRNVKDAAEGTGLNFIRGLKAKAVGLMSGQAPAEVAKRWGYEAVSKALSQGGFSAGGSLVHQEFANELIPLLRNLTVVRKAGARVVPMGASLIFDRQASAGTAYYGQENTAITPTEQTTDQVVLSEKKLTALTAVSNDLIRNASVSAEEFVRDDLLQIMAIREDLAFLRGSGTASEPLGIRNQATTTYYETISSATNPTLAEMKKELDKACLTLAQANIPMTRCAWFMAPRTKKAITAMVGPGAEGYNSLERELSDSGTLRGFPVYVTNQIPINLTTDSQGSSSELYCVDMNEVIIGESLACECEVFPNGAWSNSGTIVSGISNDQTVIRCLSKHDIALRRRAGAVVVTKLSWA